MTTEVQKIELLTEFQTYLEQNQHTLLESSHQPDLNSLLSELTALKTEIKIESRQFKKTVDTLTNTLEIIQTDKHSQEEQHQKKHKNLLLEIIDLYEHVSLSVQLLNHYQPINSLFQHSKKRDIQFIQRFKQGQLMTLKHFEQLLQHHQVETLHCKGNLFDPTTMIAIETTENLDLANGIVVEELQKGFLYQHKILRLAEVNVNKRTGNNT